MISRSGYLLLFGFFLVSCGKKQATAPAEEARTVVLREPRSVERPVVVRASGSVEAKTTATRWFALRAMAPCIPCPRRRMAGVATLSAGPAVMTCVKLRSRELRGLETSSRHIGPHGWLRRCEPSPDGVGSRRAARAADAGSTV